MGILWSPGTQVVYVPAHAGGDVEHADCEEGFVTSDAGHTVFCRFWHKGSGKLRTLVNSEGCRREDLVPLETQRQEVVDEWVARLTRIEREGVRCG